MGDLYKCRPQVLVLQPTPQESSQEQFPDLPVHDGDEGNPSEAGVGGESLFEGGEYCA